MKQSSRYLLPFFGFLILALSLRAQAQVCAQIFMDGRPRPAMRLEYPDRLLDFYRYEVQSLHRKDVAKLNEQTLRELELDRPLGTPHRATSISFRDAWSVLESVKRHPVLSPEGRKAYEHEDRDIGYCFGRATYFHLLLLRMGLQKDSIRKVWIVGPTKNSAHSDVIWDYHVATIAYTTEKGWVTLDTNETKPEPVKDWLASYYRKSLDGKSRFYVTKASKLSIDLGDYDRIQLGLNSSRDMDWFKGYFVDLMRSMRTVKLSDLGVRELERNPRDYVPQAEPIPETLERRERKTFGFFWNIFGS